MMTEYTVIAIDFDNTEHTLTGFDYDDLMKICDANGWDVIDIVEYLV